MPRGLHDRGMKTDETILTADRHRTVSIVLWIITGVVLILQLTRTLVPGLGVPLLLTQGVFTLLHGSRRYGWRAILVFCLITLVVSNAFENLSVLTGFPFGNYHYTQGPFLFLVPYLIGPAYVATGYLAWTIATLLVGEVRRGSGWLATIGTPVIASFAMVAWDLSMDPSLATIQNFWIWEDGGGFFGVPLVNFLGWSVTTYAFMQLFALYLRSFGPKPAVLPDSTTAFLAQPILLYAATASTFVVAFLTRERTTVTDAVGNTWRTGDIYETSVITAIYGMFFITVLASLSLAQRRKGRPTRETRHAAGERVSAGTPS